MKKTLLLLNALFISIIGYSQTFTEGHFTYSITTNTTVEITSYDIAGGTDVVIPETAVNQTSTYMVTNIASDAFSNKGLTMVSISNNITNIGNSAFSGNQLTNLVLPNSVEYVGQKAFSSNDLTSVTLSNNLKLIGNTAFKSNLLTTITIPSSVTNIGSYAFQANQLTSITLSNGLLAIGTKTFIDNQLTSVFIPSSVVTIGTAAFGGTLTSITSESETPPSIITGGSFDSFGSNIRSNIDLIIPSGTTGAYTTDVNAKWTGFKSVTEDLTLSISSNLELTYNITILPSSNRVEITYDEGIHLNDYEIYKTNGVILSKGKEDELSNAYLSNGVYIVKLNFNHGTIVKKIAIN